MEHHMEYRVSFAIVPFLQTKTRVILLKRIHASPCGINSTSSVPHWPSIRMLRLLAKTKRNLNIETRVILQHMVSACGLEKLKNVSFGKDNFLRPLTFFSVTGGGCQITRKPTGDSLGDFISYKVLADKLIYTTPILQQILAGEFYSKHTITIIIHYK
jgi:hypothetical protein